jgi:hypothetical protein
VKLDVFEELLTSNLYGECFQLPFSAKVDALHCTIEAAEVVPDDFRGLDIMTSDLTLKLMLNDGDKGDELAISFFDRVAELGRFEWLTFSSGDLPGCLSEVSP